MQLKIKKIFPEAKTPDYAHITDSGMDLYAQHDLTLKPGESALIGTGIAIELPNHTEAQIRPKSGLALKHQITVLNTPGTVDKGYTGEICVILINHGKKDYEVKRHQKIAQMVIAPVLRPEIVIVDDLDDSDRGSRGFGSTGL